MNFFEHQERARRQTSLLVAYYAVAVVLIIAAVYLAVIILFTMSGGETDSKTDLWDPTVFVWVFGFTAGLILLGTIFKIAQLSSGGEKIALALGGRLIAPNTTELQERRVLNVVEEMAIASGTPVPRVYVLNDEEGINAFAAGFSPADAVIGITRGTLRTLNRDELQGVIAHEFSHILNGDMRLNLRLIGVLNGILVIALVGYWVFRMALSSNSRGSSRNKKGGNTLPFVLLGLAIMVIGYVGVFFGRLIKSAVSRQREFLADASAVQFTRSPTGIAGALKKIGGLSRGSRIVSPHAEEASHLFFANGVGGFLMNLMATHPPLPERIRRLDPAFDGVFPRLTAPSRQDLEVAQPLEAVLSGAAPAPARPPPVPRFALNPAQVVASVGAPQPEHVAYAAALLAALPQEVMAAARDSGSAQGVMLGLLLSPDADLRARQLSYLSTHATPAVHRDVLRLAPALGRVAPQARLAVADLTLGALRPLARPQYMEFRRNAFELASMDASISLFEYAVLRTLLRNLDPLHGLIRRPSVRHHGLAALAEPCSVVLSTLARFGAGAPDPVARAFELGLAQLGAVPGVRLIEASRCSLEAADKALDQLAQAAPRLKERLLAACAACVTADGTVTVAEGEMLRAVADALECPVPPFLPH